jgi:hypothetical protein
VSPCERRRPDADLVREPLPGSRGDPGGTQEVGSRPGDAVNLAIVTGAPIRIGSELSSLPGPAGYASDLVSCPVATAEVQQRLRGRHGATHWKR